MPRLLSGSTLRGGGSGEFIQLQDAQPQLPPTDTTATGFTVATDALLRTTYRSSLGFIEFSTSSMYSQLPLGTIKIKSTGSTFLSTSTMTGNLVVEGGVGIGGNLYLEEDAVINGLRIGTGYEGVNNLVFRGTANTNTTGFESGQNSIAIGYDTLIGITGTNKVIAIGRYALSTGSLISNTIAIGDEALKQMGTNNYPFLATITNVTIIPQTTILNITNATPMVVTVPSHGLTTGTQIYIIGVNGISTTSGGPSIVNNNAYWVQPINTNTFSLYANKNLTVPANGNTTTYAGNIVTLTSYVNSGSVIRPVVITAQNSISTGTKVYIEGVVGTTQLNNKGYFVDYINSTTLALFNNSTLVQPENGTGYSSYVSGGKIYEYRVNDNNIAMGVNVASKLQNGDSNFFFGNNLVTNMVTGSNNTFIGHNVGANLTNVNGTIALGGDNLVDNRDNQINIGSVFYYDGRGNSDINSDARIGLGTESTSTNSGAVVVVGGLGVLGSIRSTVVGNAYEGYLVYSPTVTVTTSTPPANPRIGDIWINASIPAYLQYILDGTSTYWLQVNGL